MKKKKVTEDMKELMYKYIIQVGKKKINIFLTTKNKNSKYTVLDNFVLRQHAK